MSTRTSAKVGIQNNSGINSIKHVRRHIITCEFPPNIGGVSDFVYFLARDLAATGDEVHVWCPGLDQTVDDVHGFSVHRALGNISIHDLRSLSKQLEAFAKPKWLLIQWVPHGYRYRSLNIHFCFWVWKRAFVNRDHVELMIHEPFLSFWEGTLKQAAAAAIHRVMIILLLAAASKVWLSTWSWEAKLRPYRFGRKSPFVCLPTPNNVPVVSDNAGVAKIKGSYTDRQGDLLLGHFGTYGGPISAILDKIIVQLFSEGQSFSLLLIGKGSLDFHRHVIGTHPGLAIKVHATGSLGQDDLSLSIQACDLMIQPYPDGISSRRTTIMVCLAHGRPVVTTRGHLTEPFWQDNDAVAIEEASDIAGIVTRIRALVDDKQERLRMGKAATTLHDNRFDLRHSITALRTS